MLELLGFSFLSPWWLAGLIPAVVLLVLLYRHGWRYSAWEQLLPHALRVWLLQRHAGNGHRLRFTALGIAWILAILALAGPALETSAELKRVDDRALVIVVDLSHNMLANDLPPNRLEQARFKIRTLIQNHADSQLSLIVYAGSAHRVTPLSNDHATLINLLNALDPNIMPVAGQAVGNALTLARQVVEQRPRNSSHVILLTSGLEADGQQQLAEQAAVLGSQLSILGVGTRSGAPVPLAEGGFLRDKEGRILLPRLNSQELMTLARQHGAGYHDITAGDRDLNYLLQPLPSSTTSSDSERRSLTDHGHWLVLLLLPIAALGARRGWLGMLFAVALLPGEAEAEVFNWADLWQRADQQAVELLHNQQPAEAAKRFRDPDWVAWALYLAEDYQQAAASWAALAQADPEEPEHHFNRGTALAMDGDYPGALQAYEHALTLAPEHRAARHNRKLIEDHLEQLQQQQAEQQSDPASTITADGEYGDGESGQSGANATLPASPQTEGQGTTAPSSGAPADDSGAGNNAPSSLAGNDIDRPSGLGEQTAESTAGNSPAQSGDTLERQQSLEQWLLEIPDNPAELLRRKFLYQHLQQQDDAP